GFQSLDALAALREIPVTTVKFNAMIGTGFIGEERVLLMKPLTYMNLSGEAIRAAAEYYDIPEEKIIVLVDDVYLPIGSLRVRGKGSAGGHNGLENIILELAGMDFPRVRIGVGPQPEYMDLIDFVLKKMTKEECEMIAPAIRDGALAAEAIILNGVPAAMNRYNGKRT
ncbi:MAG: aminoacyl-tRNA hydrolase, partial [Lachnospiraceae bacterium]|nr:aminoacyl-tRNA hydrolase [Lachnospiraceae bacterium]